MTIKELRVAAGMTQRAFAEYFQIPCRTVENWESVEGSCAPYIVDLIRYKLLREGIIDRFDPEEFPIVSVFSSVWEAWIDAQKEQQISKEQD